MSESDEGKQLSPDTWYAIWVIADSRPRRDGRFWRPVYAAWQWLSDVAGCRPPPQGPGTLMSTDYDSPQLPSGYDMKRRVGSRRT